MMVKGEYFCKPCTKVLDRIKKFNLDDTRLTELHYKGLYNIKVSTMWSILTQYIEIFLNRKPLNAHEQKNVAVISQKNFKKTKISSLTTEKALIMGFLKQFAHHFKS